MSNIEQSIEEQRMALWQAQAAIETVAAALHQHIGRDWPAGVPHFPMVLKRAAADIEEVTGRLEEIAQEAKAS